MELSLNERAFVNIISTMLNEGKIDDLRQKYPNVDVEDIASNDPSRSNKYLDWMIKQVIAGHKKEDIYPTIRFFHQNIQRFKIKDINSYKDLKDLENASKELSSEQSKRKTKLADKSGAQKLYEDENFVLVRPDTKKSCQIYGANTKWCITMENASYYEQYTMSNVVFYFILKKKPQNDRFDKVAGAVQRGKNNEILTIDWFDAEDDNLKSMFDIPSLDDSYKDSLQQINSIIDRDAVQRPKAFLARLKSGEVTEKETMDYWNTIKNEDYEVRESFINALPKKFKVSLCDNFTEDFPELAAAYSKNPDVLRSLWNDKTGNDVVNQLLQNPNLPQDMFEDMFSNLNKRWSIKLLSNSALPDEWLTRYTRAGNDDEIYQLLYNEKFYVSSEHQRMLFDRLLNIDDDVIAGDLRLFTIFALYTTDETIQRKLYSGLNDVFNQFNQQKIRTQLLKNEKLSSKIIAELMEKIKNASENPGSGENDPDTWYRDALELAENPTVPVDDVRYLADRYPHGSVQRQAKIELRRREDEQKAKNENRTYLPSMPKISQTRIKEIIAEETKQFLQEDVDAQVIRDIVNSAAKLLKAVDEFKSSAQPTMISSLTPQLDQMKKTLEDMVSTPLSYVQAPKQQKVINFKPVSADADKSKDIQVG